MKSRNGMQKRKRDFMRKTKTSNYFNALSLVDCGKHFDEQKPLLISMHLLSVSSHVDENVV